jgi:DNA-binding transcriptional MocR family regulator
MTTSTKEPINLLRGWPSSTLLPASLLKAAAQTVLSDPTISTPALWYGPDPGYEPLRGNIARWLTDFYQPNRPAQAVTASRICITGGASQNLGCMLSVFTDPEYTRNIWIIAPAYFLAFRIFEDAGFGVGGKMRSVPEDEEGVDVEYLRREMKKSEEEAKAKLEGSGVDRPRFKPERRRAKVYKHVIYCVPTFSNPSSRTMSLDRRKELVRLAREFDALVVCDDVYDFLQWPADEQASSSDVHMERMKTAHLPRLVDIDREVDGGAERDGADGFGNTCSNGTFSKIAGPGIRVGWVEGTEKFVYGVSQTYVSASLLNQLTVAQSKYRRDAMLTFINGKSAGPHAQVEHRAN